MTDLVTKLTGKEQEAYAEMKRIAEESGTSSAYYPCLDVFASLLSHRQSYTRIRGFILCAAQARWDTEGKLKELWPVMSLLFQDPKAATVRQCLNAVKEIIRWRPEMRDMIRKSVEQIDLSSYRESMQSLIEKDRQQVIQLLDKGL